MAETHGFKAEVQQLLDLMIRSVYSDREVFLRELVSNAADALDKARFVALTRDDLTAAAGEPGIRVAFDADAHRITVEDDGIGLTAEEAIEHLGTIARSGSKAFLEQLAEGASGPKLIGQFGVGFYASFIVAEEVIVESLSAMPGAEPIVWRSKGQGSFSVEPGARRARGTKITLLLREDAHEFADEWRLKAIIEKHSNYLPWPVMLGDKQANKAKALWTERPSAVTDADANAFYRSISNDWQEPAARTHVSADSPIQFHAMLFVPAARPWDLFQQGVDRGPRLYARRVLISEHAKDVLPDWLRFVRGVIDSEDIPLNISREMVQKTPILSKIAKNVVGRLLSDLAKLDREPEVVEGSEEEPKENPYPGIWKNFGVLLKEGYYTSAEWREKLTPLLRFETANGDDGALKSLAQIKAAMPEGQDTIWYITASSRAQALASPHIEAVRSKGWDVIVLTDPVDEWLVQVLETYEEIPVKSVARGEIEVNEVPEADKERVAGLGTWMEGLFGGTIAGVRSSGRLTDSPCVLVDPEDGVGANMERILRAANQAVPETKRVLELNASHPLVQNLAKLHELGRHDVAEPIAHLLLDDARLMDGTVKEPAAIGRRLQALLTRATEQALA